VMRVELKTSSTADVNSQVITDKQVIRVRSTSEVTYASFTAIILLLPQFSCSFMLYGLKYEGCPINKLQNGIILLIFKI